ncbi:rho-related protein racd-related [Anaeramoeba flamelloides]|uniref:Rho-related protein racd-related n=1 Tax=Anaeramoeba flamelloides TaxID=1746091 RepID=A0AAV7YTK7_9EUKA|nr:rho-related protein racd-related [Anaeramoeba flamelloides]
MELKTSKILHVGDGAVGKTSLHYRYTQNVFLTDYIPTVADILTVNVQHNNGGISLSLYDTSGQEDWDRIRQNFYYGFDLFIISFDVSNRVTFENVKTKWKKEFEYQYPSIPILLVGTKIDLRNDEKTKKRLEMKQIQGVSTEEGIELSYEIEAYGYVECSSLTGEGVEEVFHKAIEILYDRKYTKLNKLGKKKRKILLQKFMGEINYDSLNALRIDQTLLDSQQDFTYLLSIDPVDENEIKNHHFFGSDVQFVWKKQTVCDLPLTENSQTTKINSERHEEIDQMDKKNPKKKPKSKKLIC